MTREFVLCVQYITTRCHSCASAMPLDSITLATAIAAMLTANHVSVFRARPRPLDAGCLVGQTVAACLKYGYPAVES